MTTNLASPTGGKITDEALADLQKTMGVERSIQQYNTSASDDAVRHYVLGAGDDGCREMDHRGNRHPNTMNVHRP